MKNVTIEHFEAYNKSFNFDKYWEAVGDVDYADEDDFYKKMMIGVFKSSPLLKDREVDYDEQYEKIKNDEEAKAQLFQTYSVLGMMGFWLEYKQIYKFDLDTLEMVSNSECKDLTYEELKALKMPYNCFVIENEFQYKDDVIDTTLISKREGSGVLLSIYGLVKANNSERMTRLDLIIDEGKTLFQVLEEKVQDFSHEYVKKIMNLVMYLCQPKAEILKQRVERKEDTSEKKKIKHFYKVSYDSNEVGVTLGNAIRNYKYIYEKGESLSNPDRKKGSIKKPHLRAGHFQGYWIGKGRTKLVTKYIEPTFVKGGSSDVATIHKVKS